MEHSIKENANSMHTIINMALYPPTKRNSQLSKIQTITSCGVPNPT